MHWLVVSALAVPPDERAHLAATALVAGHELRARAEGAFPEGEVELWFGLPGVSCPAEVAGCLDLRQGVVVARAWADEQGRATLTWTPPNLPPGTAWRLQVVARDPITGTGWAGHRVVRRVAPPGQATEAPELGNVLVLIADDLGVDRVGAYGLGANTRTPVLDTLADEGVRFRNAWAYPMCSPSRAALQTGRHPRRIGMVSNLNSSSGPNELSSAQLTLAELVDLSPWRDWSSSLVGKWHLSSWASDSRQNLPLVQGWDWFAGNLANLDVWVGPLPEGAGTYFWWQKIEGGAVHDEFAYHTSDVVDDAIARIDAMPEPWLLVVSFSAAHAPWTPPPPELYDESTLLPGFDIPSIEAGIVEAMDTEIGRLLDHVKPAVRARTTVVFLGDNGTPAGAIQPPQPPLREKGTLYDGGVHVPMIVTGPLVGRPGAVSDALVHVVDVFPTIAGLAGVELTDLPGVLDRRTPLALDGHDLRDVLADPDLPSEHPLLYSEYAEPGIAPFLFDRRTIRDERFKLVHDAVNDLEQFFEYVPGALDEGPDLLLCGLSPEQERARRRLRAALDAEVASLVFDNPPLVYPAGGNPQPTEPDLDTGVPDCSL